jgi:hypothetical protein
MRLAAYIDLPSGSAIFQFLIAGLLGVSVAFRSFWRRVWALLTGRRKDRGSPTGVSGDGASDGSDRGEATGPAATGEQARRRG